MRDSLVHVPLMVEIPAGHAADGSRRRGPGRRRRNRAGHDAPRHAQKSACGCTSPSSRKHSRGRARAAPDHCTGQPLASLALRRRSRLAIAALAPRCDSHSRTLRRPDGSRISSAPRLALRLVVRDAARRRRSRHGCTPVGRRRCRRSQSGAGRRPPRAPAAADAGRRRAPPTAKPQDRPRRRQRPDLRRLAQAAARHRVLRRARRLHRTVRLRRPRKPARRPQAAPHADQAAPRARAGRWSCSTSAASPSASARRPRSSTATPLESLAEIGYAAVGLGPNELQLERRRRRLRPDRTSTRRRTRSSRPTSASTACRRRAA